MLLLNKWYGIIPHLTFIWFFSFSSTSYFVPVVLYNVKKVSNSNIHIKSKHQIAERRMETKNIYFSYFWIKKPWKGNSMKKSSCMSKDGSNLTKSRFGCYFCRSLVNFKNFLILFWNIWVIYGLHKSWWNAIFDMEHVKIDLWFVIANPLIQSLNALGMHFMHWLGNDAFKFFPIPLKHLKISG